MTTLTRNLKNFLADVIHRPVIVVVYIFLLVISTIITSLLNLSIVKILTVDMLLTVVYLIGSFNIWDDDGDFKLAGNLITIFVAIIGTYFVIILLNFGLFNTIVVMMFIVVAYMPATLATAISMNSKNK